MIGEIAPCLWFNGQAEQAVRFYTRLFPNSSIGSISRWGKDGRLPEGTALLVEFTLNGRSFQALNGGPEYTLSEAVSFSVPCETQAEIDHYWDALTADGGKPVQCGWLKDRFGASWQIVPKAIGRMWAEGTPEQYRRMMAALMRMVKLDIAALEAAFKG